MSIEFVIKENWFTRPPQRLGKAVTILMSFMLFFTGFYYLLDIFHMQDWIPASREAVFQQHQYWRLWTTLWAHADLSHLFNNALLFIPLTYLLSSYFSYYFFPLLGIAMGGLVNFLVLMTMPEHTSLIGISGVVYWMGGAWFSLYLWIDRRKNLKHRFAHVVFLLMMIFVPESYSQHISYMSHFVGFVLGLVCGTSVYWIWRHQFLRAEVKELVVDEDIYDVILEGEGSPLDDINQ